MGSETSKPIKPLTKLDVEITSEKVIQYLTLAIDRKANELMKKEYELRDKLKAKNMPYEDIVIELSSIVNCFKFIKAAKIVRRYCQMVKEHSMQIVEACATRNFASIRELIPYFEGIVWSSDKLNLSYIKEFNALFYTHFGPDVYKSMKESKFVDNELRNCFASIEPTPVEINEYLFGFIERHKLTEKYRGVLDSKRGAPAKPGKPIPKNIDDPLLPPAPAMPPATPISNQQPLIKTPVDDFDAVINNLRDDTPINTPLNPSPGLAPSPAPPSDPFSFQPSNDNPVAAAPVAPTPPAHSYAPPVAPAPPRGFDKVKRMPVVANYAFTSEVDENCDEFAVDEIPFAVRIHDLRENKV